MSQSQDRAAARGGPPGSFGRAMDPEPEPEDFTIRGGEAIHVVVHAQVVPNEASLAVLHDAIRKTTFSAVLTGYAEAFAEMERMDELAAKAEASSD